MWDFTPLYRAVLVLVLLALSIAFGAGYLLGG